MTPAISLTGLSRRYGDTLALDDVSLDVRGPSITGLVGRNGAGKTTMLRIIAGHEFASAGGVRVLGESPVENDAVLRRMVFVREDQAFPVIKVRHALQVAAWSYPNWSAELAEELVADFELPLNGAVRRLSRGARSSLSAVIGLAARGEVTLFDEPYAGLDAVARRRFYDRLLRDYAEHPRVVLISTHLIDEVAQLLEWVVMIDRGRLVVDTPVDDIRGAFTTVSGPCAAVEAFVAGRAVRERRELASRESVVIAGLLHDDDRAWARELQLSLEPVSLQQAMAHASWWAADGDKDGVRA